MRNDERVNSAAGALAFYPSGNGLNEKIDNCLDPVSCSYFDSFFTDANDRPETMCAPFLEVEKKLSLMFRTIASEHERKNEIKINSEVKGNEITIAFPSVVFYTVMGELIDNALRFSDNNSTISINFSELDHKLQTVISSDGSFNIKPEADSEFSNKRSKIGIGIGLALTNKLCKYYNSHFAIYESNDQVIITLEIPLHLN